MYIDGGPPIMAYIAACSLLPQAAYVNLDLQTNTLIPSLAQTSSESWKLWSPQVGPGTSLNFTSDVRQSYSCIVINLEQICPG